MRLVHTQTVRDGIAVLTYEPVRDAERASVGATLQDKRAAALSRAGIPGGRLDGSKRKEAHDGAHARRVQTGTRA